MSELVLVKNPDLLRDSVITILKNSLQQYKVICYSEQDSEQALKVKQLPDIFMIDLATNTDHLRLVNHFLEKDVKVIVWYSKVEESSIIDYFKLGVHGYLHNEMEVGELKFAIEAIMSGHSYIHPAISQKLIDAYSKLANKHVNFPEGLLTTREWEVLELIVEGNKNEIIGEKLYISSRTVKNHITSIFRKLDVENRTNAALLSLKKGWFSF